MILRIERVTAHAVMAVLAVALGGILSLPAPAHAATVAGQVVYAIGYKDRCDGYVDVVMANATPESVTIKVNGDETSIEPMGIVTVHVPPPAEGVTKVTLKVVLGKGKPDKATHTWLKPPICIGPSATPSASASTPPSTPPSSPAPSMSTSPSPVAAQLPLTGLDVPAVTGIGVLTLLVGTGLVIGGRRRRRARHTVS